LGIVCLSQETLKYDHFNKLIENEIPLVFFDRVCESLNVPKVIVDGNEAARKITHHFYDNGCRRIAYISGPPQLNISKNRLEGYLEGLKECGLEFESDLLEECNLSTEDAIKATSSLLNKSTKPDAIFGLNDTIAFAAMKEIKKRGLKIPDDIALVGFTDEFHSTVVEPALTSVTHPTFDMGKEAAKLFFKLVKKGRDFKKEIKLKTELIIRESSIRNY